MTTACDTRAPAAHRTGTTARGPEPAPAGTGPRAETRAAIRTAVGAAAGERRTPPGAVEKSLLILDILPGDGNAIGVSEVARRIGLPKTTVHRILGLLTELGLAEHRPAGYGLGRRIIDLVRETPCMRTTQLRDRLLPYLCDLYRLTDEAVHLGVLRDQGVLCLERLHGVRSAALPVRVGSILPAHGTAMGKVLLAFADDVLREEWLTTRLTAHTARTLTGGAALQRELELVRSRGFAVDRGEFRPQVMCLAAPVWGRGRTLAAAVSVSGPAHRLDPAETTRQLRHVAHAASRALASAPDGHAW
ncbi:IclR family transcriptional regulator [Streptomyces sp. NPDC057682]|uniref:IclR family transcriptional regulator n=1 Tax=Streptomyces sp. NPDC057682 TaxID=3346210 RepID=UPI0036D04874